MLRELPGVKRSQVAPAVPECARARVKTADWRGPMALRQAQYRIQVEKDGQVFSGRAYLGGWFTGPIWSSKVQFQWDEEGKND